MRDVKEACITVVVYGAKRQMTAVVNAFGASHFFCYIINFEWFNYQEGKKK